MPRVRSPSRRCACGRAPCRPPAGFISTSRRASLDAMASPTRTCTMRRSLGGILSSGRRGPSASVGGRRSRAPRPAQSCHHFEDICAVEENGGRRWRTARAARLSASWEPGPEEAERWRGGCDECSGCRRWLAPRRPTGGRCSWLKRCGVCGEQCEGTLQTHGSPKLTLRTHICRRMAAVRLQIAICHYTSDVIGVICRIWGAVIQLAMPWLCFKCLFTLPVSCVMFQKSVIKSTLNFCTPSREND